MLLRNLIDNAVRYSPEHRPVRIGIEPADGYVCLEVLDQGPGIAADQRQRLGQRFQRLDRADTGGTGLGLSIAKCIAELHDAELCFEAGDDGRGLRVTVRFAGVAAPSGTEAMSSRRFSIIRRALASEPNKTSSVRWTPTPHEPRIR